MVNKIKNVQKRMKEKTRTNKGITLIALVITIIVLLILAGVSIAMLTGENGILTQAQNAKNRTAEAEAQERQDLEDQNALIENLVGGGSTTGGNDNIKEYHNNVPIPKGFYYVGGEKDTGLVISDLPEDDMENTKKGNQFVWVPVDDINDMAQCETAGGDCNLQLIDGVLKCTNPDHSETAEKIVGKLWATELGENFGTENTTYRQDSGLREPDLVTNYDNNTDYNNGLFTPDSLKADYKAMATSVKKNGGFYIGRYETSLSTATDKDAGTSGTACSKSGVLPTSAGNAATSMWYGLYSISKTYTVAENSVESTMIWGSQYDAMLNWVKNGNSADKKKKKKKTNGNHSGNLATTGNSTYSNDSINNIRDLGGNLREWTLEAVVTSYRVYRGGYCNYNDSPSYRDRNDPADNTLSSHGSRLTLYIK